MTKPNNPLNNISEAPTESYISHSPTSYRHSQPPTFDHSENITNIAPASAAAAAVTVSPTMSISLSVSLLIAVSMILIAVISCWMYAQFCRQIEIKEGSKYPPEENHTENSRRNKDIDDGHGDSNDGRSDKELGSLVTNVKDEANNFATGRHDVEYTAAIISSNNISISCQYHNASSIWEKLAEENDRRAKLRVKLSSHDFGNSSSKTSWTILTTGSTGSQETKENEHVLRIGNLDSSRIGGTSPDRLDTFVSYSV